jgi:hypothetical protein
MLTSDKTLADHTVVLGSLFGVPSGGERVSNKFEIACTDPKQPTADWHTSCSVVGWSEDSPCPLDSAEADILEGLRQGNVAVRIVYEAKQDFEQEFSQFQQTADEFKLHKTKIEGRTATFDLLNGNMSKCRIPNNTNYRFSLKFKENIKHLFSTSTAVKYLSKGFDLKFDSKLPQKSWDEMKLRLSRGDHTNAVNPFVGNMLGVKNSKLSLKIKPSRMNHFINSTSGDDSAFLLFVQNSVQRMMVAAFYQSGIEMNSNLVSRLANIPLNGIHVGIKLGNCYEIISIRGSLSYLLDSVSLKLQASLPVYHQLQPTKLELLENDELIDSALGRMQRLRDLAKNRRGDRRRDGFPPNQRSMVISEIQKKEAADFSFTKNTNKVTISVIDGGKIDIQTNLPRKDLGVSIEPPKELTKKLIEIPPPPPGNPATPMVKPPSLNAILKKQKNKAILGIIIDAEKRKKTKIPAPLIQPAPGVILPPPSIITKEIVSNLKDSNEEKEDSIIKPPPLGLILKKQLNKSLLELIKRSGDRKEKKSPAPVIPVAPGIILPPPSVVSKVITAIPKPPPGLPSAPMVKPPDLKFILNKQKNKAILKIISKSESKETKGRAAIPLITPAPGIILPPPAVLTKSIFSIPAPPIGSPSSPMVKPPPIDLVLKKQLNKGLLGLIQKAGTGADKEKKPPAPLIPPAPGIILPPPAVLTKSIFSIPAPPIGSPSSPMVKPPPIDLVLKKQLNKGLLGLIQKAGTGADKEKKPPAPLIPPAPGIILPPPAVLTKSIFSIPAPPIGSPSSPMVKPPPIDLVLKKQLNKGLLGLIQKAGTGADKEKKPPAPLIPPAPGIILPPPAVLTKSIFSIPAPPIGSPSSPMVKPPPIDLVLKKQLNKGLLGLIQKAGTGADKEKKPPAPLIPPAPGIILPPPAVLTKSIFSIPAPPIGSPSSPMVKPPPIDLVLKKQLNKGLLGLIQKAGTGADKEKKPPAPLIPPAPGIILPPPAVLTKSIFSIPAPPIGSPSSPMVKPPPIDLVLKKQLNKGLLGLIQKAGTGADKEKKPPAPLIPPAPGIILPPPAVLTKSIFSIPAPPIGSPSSPMVKPPPIDLVLKKQLNKGLLGLIQKAGTGADKEKKPPAPLIPPAPGIILPPPAVLTKSIFSIPAPPIGSPSSPMVKPPPIDLVLKKQLNKGLLGLIQKAGTGADKEKKPPAPLIPPAPGIILPPPAVLTKSIFSIPAPPIGSPSSPMVKPPPIDLVLKKQLNKGLLGLIQKAGTGADKEKKPPAPLIPPAPGIILPPPAVLTKSIFSIPAPPIGSPSSPMVKPPPIDLVLKKQLNKGLLGLIQKAGTGADKEKKPPAPLIPPAPGIILPPPAVLTKSIFSIPAPPIGSPSSPMVKPPPIDLVLKKQLNKGLLGLIQKAGTGADKEKKPPAPLIPPAPGIILPPPAVLTKSIFSIPAPPIGSPSSPMVKPPPIDLVLKKQLNKGLLGLIQKAGTGADKEKKPPAPLIPPAPGIILPPPAVLTKSIFSIPAPPIGSPSSPMVKPPPIDLVLKKQLNKGLLGLIQKAGTGADKEKKPPAPLIPPAPGIILPPPAVLTKSIFSIPAPPIGSPSSPMVKPPPIDLVLKKQLNKGLLGLIQKAGTGADKEKKPPAPLIPPAPGIILPPPAVLTKSIFSIPAPPIGSPSSPMVKPPPIDLVLKKQLNKGLLGLIQKAGTGADKEKKPPAPLIPPAPGIILPPPAVLTKSIFSIPAPPIGSPSSPMVKPPPIDLVLKKQLNKGLLGLIQKAGTGADKEKKPPAPLIPPAPGIILPPPAVLTKSIFSIPAPPIGSPSSPMVKPPPIDLVLKKQLNKGLLGLIQKAGTGADKEKKPPAPLIPPAPGIILPPPAVLTKSIFSIPAPPIGSPSSPMVKPPPIDLVLKKQLNKGLLGLIQKAGTGADKEKKPPAPLIPPAPGIILPPPAVLTKSIFSIPAPPIGSPSSPMVKPPPIDLVLKKQLNKGLLGLIQKAGTGADKEKKPPAPLIPPAPGIILPPPAVLTKSIFSIPAPPIGSPSSPMVKPPPIDLVLKKQLNKGLLGLIQKAGTGADKEKKPPAPLIPPAPGIILPPPAVLTKSIFSIPAPPIGSPSSPMVKPPPIDLVLKKQLNKGLLGLIQKAGTGADKEKKPPAPLIPPAPGIILPPPAVLTKSIFSIPAPPIGSPSSPMVKPPPIDIILKKQINRFQLSMISLFKPTEKVQAKGPRDEDKANFKRDVGHLQAALAEADHRMAARDAADIDKIDAHGLFGGVASQPGPLGSQGHRSNNTSYNFDSVHNKSQVKDTPADDSIQYMDTSAQPREGLAKYDSSGSNLDNSYLSGKQKDKNESSYFSKDKDKSASYFD